MSDAETPTVEPVKQAEGSDAVQSIIDKANQQGQPGASEQPAAPVTPAVSQTAVAGAGMCYNCKVQGVKDSKLNDEGVCPECGYTAPRY